MAVKYRRRPHAKCKRCGHSYQAHSLAQARKQVWYIPTACMWCPDCPEYIGTVKLGERAQPRGRR